MVRRRREIALFSVHIDALLKWLERMEMEPQTQRSPEQSLNSEREVPLKSCLSEIDTEIHVERQRGTETAIA